MKHKVSVVVVTKNRPEYLSLCLESIAQQTYENIEYIIVDADSNQETLKLIDKYMGIIPLRLINAGDCTIGYARQVGFRESTGDIIAYVDSDVELPHDEWIQHMLVPFKQSYIAGVQTLAKNKPGDHPALKRIHSSFEYKNMLINLKNYEPVGTSHILIRKVAIADVNGFIEKCRYIKPDAIHIARNTFEYGYSLC